MRWHHPSVSYTRTFSNLNQDFKQSLKSQKPALYEMNQELKEEADQEQEEKQHEREEKRKGQAFQAKLKKIYCKETDAEESQEDDTEAETSRTEENEEDDMTGKDQFY